MPHPRKERGSGVESDYFYDEDRDVRSNSHARNRQRSVRAKYGKNPTIRPGQLNELKRERLPEHKLFYGGHPEEVKWSKDPDSAEVSPARWTKRELYKHAQQSKEMLQGCSCFCCCREDTRDRLARLRAGAENWSAPLARIKELEDAEDDVRAHRREASGEGRLSRSEDSIAWGIHGDERRAIDAIVSKATSEFERKRERKIQNDWTVLKEGRGSSSRSHQDDWEVLSTSSW